LKWRKLTKVVKKFTFINEIRINKKGLSKMARENAVQIITAFCQQVKSIELIFGSLSLSSFDMFGQKFGDKIKEIKILCYKHGNECGVCINISRLLSFSCNKKCNIKLIYKNLLED
jgi:hypothetical protein